MLNQDTAGQAVWICHSLNGAAVRRAMIVMFRTLAGGVVVAAFAQVGVQLVRLGAFRASLPVNGGWLSTLLVIAYLVVHLTALGACSIATVLIFRAWQREDARALALFLAFFSLFWGALFRFFHASLSAEGDVLNFGITFGPGLSAFAYASLVLAVASFLRFSALFPEPLHLDDPMPGRRRMALPTVLRSALVHPKVVWGIAGLLISVFVVPRFGLPWNSGTSASRDTLPFWLWLQVIAYNLVYALVPVILIVAGVQNLLFGLRRSVGVNRRRVLWTFAGFFIAMWMILVDVGFVFLPDLPFSTAPLLILFAPLVIVVTLTVAVFYRGDLDPSLVIKRTTIYGVFGTLFLIMFAAAESLVSEILEARLGLPNLMGGALAGGAVAAAILPFRHRMTAWVDRLGLLEKPASDRNQ